MTCSDPGPAEMHLFTNFDEGRICQCGSKTVRATLEGYLLVQDTATSRPDTTSTVPT